ncbi:MAG: molybdopterin molybdotransferase MoeA [bacterium]
MVKNKDKRRERPLDTPLMPYEEALEKVMNAALAKLGTETVSVKSALGRVLRENVKAGFDIPPFDKSAMDGYALRSEDSRGASADKPVRLEVLEDLPAGKTSGLKLKSGQAVRIMTGAPLPAGADAVVKVEDTRGEAAGFVDIAKEVRPGDNSGRAGEDVQKGRTVLSAGTRVSAAVMGMLAAMGRQDALVSRRQRTAIISTGDEVQMPGKELRPGAIYDANGYSLLGLCREHGCRAEFLGIARDRPGALDKKLSRARDADVVLLSGGVSVGDYDFVLDLLQDKGYKEVFYKAAIKPGKPTFAGKRGSQLVFGLPGNPVSAMVCFHLFVRPVLDKISGRSEHGMRKGRAIMAGEVRTKAGRRKFLRGKLVSSGPCLEVKTYHDQKSGVLSSMLDADVLIDVPGERTVVESGSEVDVWRLRED